MACSDPIPNNTSARSKIRTWWTDHFRWILYVYLWHTQTEVLKLLWFSANENTLCKVTYEEWKTFWYSNVKRLFNTCLEIRDHKLHLISQPSFIRTLICTCIQRSVWCNSQCPAMARLGTELFHSIIVLFVVLFVCSPAPDKNNSRRDTRRRHTDVFLKNGRKC